MNDGNIEKESGGGRWDASRILGNVDQLEVRLSRGFLRSKPEKWFPGLASHWMPLAHSLGVNLKVQEIRPLTRYPSSGAWCYQCTLDGEPLSVFVDASSAAVLLDAVVPDAFPEGANVCLEYLARRLITSLAGSWSASESSVVRFEGPIDASQVQGVAAVKLACEVNAGQCVVWIVVGGNLASRLDGLWKRQLKSSANAGLKTRDIRVVASELAVPTTMLAEYLNSGALVDLEVPVSDRVTLFAEEKPWMNARLLNSNGHLVIENSGPAQPLSALPDGTTRLLVSFGTVAFDSAKLTEFSQVGARLDAGRDVSESVEMIVRSEKVADAALCTWQGRLAIRVR